MGPSVIVYVEHIDASLLEAMLFSVSKEVRSNRKGNIWEFMMGNDLYRLSIEEASLDKMKEDLYEKKVIETGSFYAVSLSTNANEVSNHIQMDQLIDLISNVLPVYGVART